MGPPLCSDGNHPTRQHIKTPAQLQWGRRFAATETIADVRRSGRGRRASMGPPLCSDGNQTSSSRRSSSRSSFNGAAALQRRKLLAMCSSSWSRQGFNGAAALQRRIQKEYREDGVVCFVLQWGRRFAATETCDTDIGDLSPYWLQWGRRFAATETGGFPPCGMLKLNRLQWGRRFAATETCTMSAKTIRQNQLQWGRRFAATETATGCSVRPGTERLQWGRRFAATETPAAR